MRGGERPVSPRSGARRHPGRMQRTPRRRIQLRSETLRTLTPLDLRRVAAGRQAGTAAADSCEPCPGEYTWFCKP